MTNEQLNDTWNILQSQIAIYNENKAYVDGKNPELLNEPKKKDPDNRVPVPFARATVNDMTGYSGKNINVYYENISMLDENDAEEDEYNDILQQVQKYNDDKLLMSEVYKEALTQKEAYLLFWVSDELGFDRGLMTPEYQLVTMKEMVVFESNTLKPVIEKAVRFVAIDKDTTEAIVYYPEYAEAYRKLGSSDWVRYEEGDIEYPYARVPVVKFKMSKEGGAIFNPQKKIIDSHDKAISKAQNEIDRFNALIALFPGKVTKEFIDKLEQLKVIDELSTYEKWPEYLEKNLQGVEVYLNKQLDRIERLYHKTIEVPDMTTQDFASGDESGAARAFKLLGMEFLAADIESYFKKGFRERTKLFNDVIEASTLGIDTKDYTTKVIMARNLPIDEASKVTIASQLKGLGLSNETIFRFLPETIIEDVDKELKATEENEPEDIFEE